MQIIYKYEILHQLAPFIFIEMEMPKDAQFLSVKNQNNKIKMWFLTTPVNNLEHRRFMWAPTGISFDTFGLKFLGTVEIETMVYHIFEQV